MITGVTGFVGKNLLLQAMASGAFREVVALVRSPEKLLAGLEKEGWKEPNLRIVRWVPGSWEGRCEFAVHCAGVLFGRSEAEYRMNVECALDLLRVLPSWTKVILISSQSAGGPTPYGYEVRDERMPDQPLTLYGKSKRKMERACFSSFPDRDLVVIRPPMILGARDQATLPLFRLAAGVLRPKPGLPSKSYSFLSVRDLCAAIFTVLKQDTKALGHRSFYVCNPNPVSDRDLIECAAELLNKRGWILPLPHPLVRAASLVVDAIPALRQAVPNLTRDRVREIFPNRWVIDGRRFEETFRFHCTTGLKESLSDALMWYQQSGALL